MTSAQRNGRGTPTADELRARRSPEMTIDHIAGPDGRLSLLDQAGGVVHVATPGVTESLRYMLARLRLGDGDELPERLGVISAIRGEGVTFMCRSLALVLTYDAAKRVCIVDLNWWAPSDWPQEDASAGGVAEVLRGTVPLEQALVSAGNPGLHILPAGSAAVSERPALARHPELEKLLVELSEDFDHVLLDLPAVHSTSEALSLAENCQSVAVVVGQGVTPLTQVKTAIEALNGVSVLGVVLNRSHSKIPRLLRNRIPGA